VTLRYVVQPELHNPYQKYKFLKDIMLYISKIYAGSGCTLKSSLEVAEDEWNESKLFSSQGSCHEEFQRQSKCCDRLAQQSTGRTLCFPF